MLDFLQLLNISGPPSVVITVALLIFVGIIFQFFVLGKLRENTELQTRLKGYEESTAKEIVNLSSLLTSNMEHDRNLSQWMRDIEEKISRIDSKAAKVADIETRIAELKNLHYELHKQQLDRMKEMYTEVCKTLTLLGQYRDSQQERFAEVNRQIGEGVAKLGNDYQAVCRDMDEVLRVLDNIKEKLILQTATLSNLANHSAVGIK